MFFDDRLATVLRQNAQSDAMRRTQYRQLLDLLGAQASGTRQAARDPSLIAAAWMRMNRLAETIPAKDRARLINEPGWRLRNPELVAHLAEFEPDVASAALSRAQLSSEDWVTLVPRLPVRARGFLRLQRDLPEDVEVMLEQLGIHDRGLPNPDGELEPVAIGEAAGGDESADRDAAPLDLAPSDELPGANIPPEDLPSEPFTVAPIGPALGSSSEESEEGTAPSDPRPIFFPKNDRNLAGREQANDGVDEDQDFTPDPFTIEELREIAPEPLNIDEAKDEDEDESDQAAELAEAEAYLEKLAPRPEPDADNQADGRSEISALVERISNFQRARETAPRSAENPDKDFPESGRLMPRLPLGEDEDARVRIVSGFGFAADAAGRIEWAEDDIAPMVVGTRLVVPSRLQDAPLHDPLTSAFNLRQPMKSARFVLRGAPAVAGEWVVDAQPRFSQIGGFSGYVGRMRRPLEPAKTGPSPAQKEADRIRQLLHELRTPVTAVQGYSEVIQQQLFGSAPHEYRALAAAIASDAARILSGFEELDRLAKLETGVLEVDDGQTDIAPLAQRMVRQLGQVLDARMAGIELTLEGETGVMAAIDSESAESLLWRLLASIGGASAAGETLKAHFTHKDELVMLSCELPMQLLGEDDLFAADARPSATAINPGIFGAGFALRLARAEARARGGDVVRKNEAIVLKLPKAVQDKSTIKPELTAH